MIISEQPNQALEDGTWVEYQGARLKIAHAGSIKFQRRMQALQKPFRRKIERNEMDPADQKRILTQAIGEALLLDWSGVKNSKGEEVPYSAKTAVTALRNDEALREFVMEFSTELQNFRDEEEEHEGNS